MGAYQPMWLQMHMTYILVVCRCSLHRSDVDADHMHTHNKSHQVGLLPSLRLQGPLVQLPQPATLQRLRAWLELCPAGSTGGQHRSAQFFERSMHIKRPKPLPFVQMMRHCKVCSWVAKLRNHWT